MLHLHRGKYSSYISFPLTLPLQERSHHLCVPWCLLLKRTSANGEVDFLRRSFGKLDYLRHVLHTPLSYPLSLDTLHRQTPGILILNLSYMEDVYSLEDIATTPSFATTGTRAIRWISQQPVLASIPSRQTDEILSH